MPLQYPGVYVKGTHFVDSLRALCGYLGFTSTGDFRKWASDTKLTPITDPFIAADKACFGLTGPGCKREKAIPVRRIMSMYQDPGILRTLSTVHSLDDIKPG